MNKKKIRLTTSEMVSGFINVRSKYDCDINLYDESIISSFIEDMRKFEV